MSDKKFDLNKFLQQPKLFTSIDYSGVVVPDLSETQKVVQNFEDWRKSQGYKTEEERQEELKSRIAAIQERTKDLGDEDSATDWYHTMAADDPEAIAEWDRQAANVTGHGIGAITTIASAGTLGWIPSLISTAGGYAGGYGGYKAGEYIDNKYGTNIAPWLSLAGGFAGGIGGYKGLVKTGSAGLLKGSGQMYGKQFMGDVVTDFMNKKLSNPDLYKNILSQNLHNSHTNLTDNWSNLPPIKVSVDDITDWNKLGAGKDAEYLNQHLPLSPVSELRTTHPTLTVDPLVPDAIAENTGKLVRFGSDKGKPIYKHYFPDGNGNIEIDGKLYHIGKPNRPETNTLVHQGNRNPIINGKLQPISGKIPEEPTAIWWEQNTPYYGKQSKTQTFVIDDVVPSASAKAVTRFGNSTSRLTDVVDLADPKTNFKFFTYDPISGEMVQSPFVIPKQQSTKGSYAWFEKPSKLTEAERLGIPKGDRANLTQDQLDGLADLQNYLQSGRYRWRLNYNDETGFTRTTKAGVPEGSVPGVKALVDAGATSKGYEGAPISFNTKRGNWTVWPSRKNSPAKFSGGDFPIPEGMGWAPGDLSVMLDGNSGKALKVVMTSPKVDYINSMMDDASQALIESLPNTIDKNIMRRFWQNNDQIVLPGSYLSGDNGALPLGHNAIKAIDDGRGAIAAISEITHPSKFKPHGSGLSPDSMLSILKQGQRPGHAVRYGPGFRQLNDSAVYNKHIYDAWKQYKSKEISAEEFKKMFDDWFVPQGGRPLEIKQSSPFMWVKNNDGTKNLISQPIREEVIFPHPYIHYKKEGGKINPQQ